MTNRGFVELHNPTGFFLVGLGFLLVTLIIAAGGIFAKMIERESKERRRLLREDQAVADVSGVSVDAMDVESVGHGDVETTAESSGTEGPGPERLDKSS